MMATLVRRMQSVNPATEDVIEEIDMHDGSSVENVIASVHRSYAGWRVTPVDQRATLMRAAAAVLRSERSHYATLITREMGKPITESEAEIDKCAFTADYYADNAALMTADEAAPTDSSRSFVAYEPIGIVVAVMPWNFPFWQVMRFAVPGLMAGNVGILKHASNVPRCALEIEDVFRCAGFPDNVFRTLLVSGGEMANVIADPRIRAVTLTGSDQTGSEVAKVAGRELKKTVLELGGSDAFIVLEDADVEGAARTAVKSRFLNCGQTCIAAKRFIVVDAVAEEFEERVVAETLRLPVGDPMDRTTRVGPMARDDLRADLERQVTETVGAGGVLRTGGRRRDGVGWFFEPTVITGCSAEMTAFREETFGPLAAVTRVAGPDEAIDVANDSPYGLGGNIWTRDVDRGIALARRLDTGGVFVNGMTHSDPRAPFGGVKRSGYGRELSHNGIHEFMNIQTIWVAEDDGVDG